MDTTNYPGVKECKKDTPAFDIWYAMPGRGFYLNKSAKPKEDFKLHEKHCKHLKDRNSPSANTNTKYAASTAQALLDMTKAEGKIIGTCQYCLPLYPSDVERKIKGNDTIGW